MSTRIQQITSSNILKRWLWIVAVTLSFTFAYYVQTEKSLDSVNEKAAISYELMDEIKVSAHEQTIMARSFAVTREVIYQQRFQDVIDIRRGKRANPTYMDKNLFIYDGPIEWIALLKRIGCYSQEELDALQQANVIADRLAQTEAMAMAIAAEHPDFDLDRQRALQMLFDDDYNLLKQNLFQQVDTVIRNLHQRMAFEIKAAEEYARYIRVVVIILSLVFASLTARLYTLWQATLHYQQLYNQLASTQTKLNAFLDNSPALVWIKESTGHLAYINKSFEQHFGVTFQEWQNKTDDEL